MDDGLSNNRSERRWSKWLWRAAAGALIVLAAAAGTVLTTVLALRHLPTETLRLKLAHALSVAFDRRVEIEQLTLEPLPHLGARVTGLRLFDTDGHILIEAPSVHLRADVSDLARFEIGIPYIEFDGPVVAVGWPAGGRSGLVRLIKEISGKRTSGRASVFRLLFHRFRVRDARLLLSPPADRPALPRALWVDGTARLSTRITGAALGFNASLSVPRSGTAQVSGSIGSSLSLAVTLDRIPARWLNGPERPACDGTVSGRARFERSGRAQDVSFDAKPDARCEGVAAPQLTGRWTARRASASIDVVARSTGTAGHVTGRWTLAPSAPLSFNVSADRINGPEIAAWIGWASGAMEAGRSQPRDDHPRPWKITVAASTATWAPDRATAVRFVVDGSTDGVIQVRDVDGRMYGGTLRGSLSVASGTWTVDAQAFDLDAENLSRRFFSTEPLTGIVNGRAHVTFPSGAQPLLHADGQAEVQWTDGQMPKTPAVLKTLTSANLRSLESFLKNKEDEPGLHVDEGRATVLIKPGRWIAKDPWTLRSHVMEAAFVGSVDLNAQTIDGTLVLRVLTVADEIIGQVPILRSLLRGDTKSFLPIWLRLRGPLKDPDVDPLALKSITAPIFNSVERLLRWPASLFGKKRDDKSGLQ